jgi:hypothetical protein
MHAGSCNMHVGICNMHVETQHLFLMIATQPIGLVLFQARGLLPVAEEQSRPRGGQSGGVEDQPQYCGLWRSRTPNARSLSRSPSSPPPSFTQSPSPPRSLVRDGQTSPHRPRLVVSRSTCPPLSPSPHANSPVTGTALTNTHKFRFYHAYVIKPRGHPLVSHACFLRAGWKFVARGYQETSTH